MYKLILVLAVLLGVLIGSVACTRRIPEIQFSTSGADHEYTHGAHCIDMRAF